MDAPPLPHWPSWRSAMWKHCSTFLTKSIINKTWPRLYSSLLHRHILYDFPPHPWSYTRNFWREQMQKLPVLDIHLENATISSNNLLCFWQSELASLFCDCVTADKINQAHALPALNLKRWSNIKFCALSVSELFKFSSKQYVNSLVVTWWRTQPGVWEVINCLVQRCGDTYHNQQAPDS